MNKIYYCKTGGHYWHYSDDGETPLFLCDVKEVQNYLHWKLDGYTVEDFDNAENKYCGCNE